MMMVANSGVASVSTPSIAAIGIVKQVVLIGIAMSLSMSTGGTAMISRHWGASEEENIPNIIIMLDLIFQALSLSIFGSMRGTGDTRAPMVINVLVDLLNVDGNYILIFGKLGLPV